MGVFLSSSVISLSYQTRQALHLLKPLLSIIVGKEERGREEAEGMEERKRETEEEREEERKRGRDEGLKKEERGRADALSQETICVSYKRQRRSHLFDR